MIEPIESVKSLLMTSYFPFRRVVVDICGGGTHQETLQEPSGGHGAGRLPLTQEAGGAADKTDWWDTGETTGPVGGDDHG